jgi:hypothetical protein
MSFENFIVTDLNYFLYQGPGITIVDKKKKKEDKIESHQPNFKANHNSNIIVKTVSFLCKNCASMTKSHYLASHC